MTKLKIIVFNLILISCLSVCFTLVSGQEVPEACVWKGINGTCVSPRVCLTSLDKRSEKQPVCVQPAGTPESAEPRICCTDCELVNDTRNFIISASGGTFWKDGRKARDQCLQYLNDLPHICHQDGFYGGISRTVHPEKGCHIYNMWGIGGAPPPGAEPPSVTPYEALMGFGADLESAVWLTAGTIISDKFILTSGHEHLTTKGPLPLKFAALGVKNRKSDKSEWQIRKVKKIYTHPEFDGLNTFYNDLALLELETSIEFNKDVLPACLPDPDELFDMPKVKFSMWKQPSFNMTQFTETPNVIYVKEVSANECGDKIKEQEPSSPAAKLYNKFLPNGINATTQLCYGQNNSCLNMIGGPVVVTTYISRCMNTVVGVNAFSYSCGVAVFTRVSHYVPWIESIVWP